MNESSSNDTTPGLLVKFTRSSQTSIKNTWKPRNIRSRTLVTIDSGIILLSKKVRIKVNKNVSMKNVNQNNITKITLSCTSAREIHDEKSNAVLIRATLIKTFLAMVACQMCAASIFCQSHVGMMFIKQMESESKNAFEYTQYR